MKTHTIFFDLERMYRQLSACTHIDKARLHELCFSKGDVLQGYEVGRYTSEQLYQMIQKYSDHPFSFREMMQAMGDIFTLNNDICPVIQELKERGHRLVLLSNTNECHFQFAYTHFPILQTFDRLILSYEVRSCKPNSAIFRRALKEATGPTFYTDDIAAFVEAGRTAGLDAEIFIDVPTLKKHLTARDILKYTETT